MNLYPTISIIISKVWEQELKRGREVIYYRIGKMFKPFRDDGVTYKVKLGKKVQHSPIYNDPASAFAD